MVLYALLEDLRLLRNVFGKWFKPASDRLTKQQYDNLDYSVFLFVELSHESPNHTAFASRILRIRKSFDYFKSDFLFVEKLSAADWHKIMSLLDDISHILINELLACRQLLSESDTYGMTIESI